MKKFLRFFSLFFVLVSFMTALSCAPSGSSIDVYAFNTAIHVETHDKKISDQTTEQLKNEIARLDRDLDAHENGSYIYQLNGASDSTALSVSSDVIDLIKLAKEYSAFTLGKFNFALYPVIDAWQFYDYPKLNFAPPSEDSINALLSSGVLSPDNIIVDEINGTISKSNADTKIDLGGIAKGYVANVIADRLKQDGHTSGYVNVGGSSLYLLSVDSLTIKHPRATEKKPTVIKIYGQNAKNTAVSTSGDYQRYYNYDGKIYSHIIDGESASPIDTNIISATILCNQATFADAITTALCCHEYFPDDHQNSPLIIFAKKVIESTQNCTLFLVYEKGDDKIILTNATSDKFELLDTDYTIKQI